MNAADVLEKAADVIVERGWTQATAVSPTGCVCATGALALAGGSYSAWSFGPEGSAVWVACAALEAHLGLRIESRGEDLVRWNDAPGRTADEVITALRSCAASLRAAS